MLFFRSEDLVKAWCEARGAAPNPCVRLDQLWTLATAWYGTRLTPESKRPSPAEMRGIFASVGLSGPFWDPEARG
jgi:hypothetical protein